jgi:nitrous oxide reductase accessory protein NosL
VGEWDNPAIYEIDSGSGVALRRLQVGKNQANENVACVNGDKFLSFQDIKGKLVPLIGTAEPKDSSAQ